MCGIVGIWNIDGSKVDQQELDRFTNSLTHRGPDGRGTYIDKKASLGLGHRRLSILDLTDSGHQPMSYGDGKYWITYNGEIYNFLELRKELEGLGHRFRSKCDTEVILAAYAEWGEKCQFKFNGMWAFAIWDLNERKLFLSRDRFGVKPLFYLYNGKHFVFASELKAFMTLGPVLRPGFDDGMIASMQNDESVKKTILQGVRNLNGGHCMTVNESKSPVIKRWWRTIDNLMDVSDSFEGQVEQYRELFFDACRIRMRSDVPIGTAISGGVDSSSILCTIADIGRNSHEKERMAKDWQRSFVLDYTDTSHSEKRFVKKVTHHAKVNLIYKELPAKLISPEIITSAIFSLEAIQTEPHIGPWLIYKEMKKNGVFVSIDGHGGDETITGYHHYPNYALKDALWPWKINRWRDIQNVIQGLYEKEDELEFGLLPFLPSRGQILKSFFSKDSITATVKQQLQDSPALYNIIRSVSRNLRSMTKQKPLNNGWLKVLPADPLSLKSHSLVGNNADNLNRQLYHDFHFGCLTQFHRNYDRDSMAHGVEIRAPFLDWRLVAFSFSLPSSSKLGDGYTKRILREAMKNILPDSIRLRKSKIGFASPMVEWYASFLKEFVLDSINNQDFLESHIWNGPYIKHYTEKCFSNKDYVNATKSWKFIQAMILMQQFKMFANK